MAYADEHTPPGTVLQMLLAAQCEFKSLEEKAALQNEVAHLKRKLFGKSSEKLPKPDPQIFDEAKATSEDLEKDAAIRVASDTLDESIQSIEVAPLKRVANPKGRKPIPAHYPRVEVVHDLAENQKICTCGHNLAPFGEEVSEQLEVIPARICVIRHRRLKYACKVCCEGVTTAPVKTQAIAKCLAAPGLLAHVAAMKFDDHLPLYRQSEIWNRIGVDLSRATLSSWILKMGAALNPLVAHMQKHIVKSGYVKADETTAHVLKTPEKTGQSYMWVYMTGNDSKPTVVYDYQQSRKGAFAQAFLTNFAGVLQTDGYSGYHCVTNQDTVKAMGCWAHARRKFHDVWALAKEEGVASKALDIIGKLYDIEDEIKPMSVAEKYRIRQEKAKPILASFQEWLLGVKPHVQAKGLLDKAVQYTLNQWDCLSYYAQDGGVDIDNNAAERQIRPFAIGRKNWLFMGSPKGAQAAATLYSLIETAKLNNLNPEGYLKFILEHVIDPNDITLLDKLMPWNVTMPKEYTKTILQPEENTS